MMFCFIYTSISYYLSAQLMTWTRFLMFLFVCQLMTLISEGIGLILGTAMNPVVSRRKILYKSRSFSLKPILCIFLEWSVHWFDHHLSVYSLRRFLGTFQPHAYYPVLCVLHQLHEVCTRRAGRLHLRLWPWTSDLFKRRRLLPLPLSGNDIQWDWYDRWKVLDGHNSDGWIFVCHCDN